MHEFNKIQIITSQNLNELKIHESAWDDLLKKCPYASPMQSYAWIYNYYEYAINENMKWICLFAYEENKLVLVYPLIYSSKKGIQGFSLQVFQSPFNAFHTVHTDGLILQGFERVLELLVGHIHSIFRVFPVIKITGNLYNSASNRCFNIGNEKLTFFRVLNGTEEIINIEENFDSFLSGLTSKFKREILRRERKLQKNFQIRYLSKFTENSISNDECLREFLEIEDSGWKAKKGTSLKKIPKAGEFLSRLTLELYDSGWLGWNLLEANNKVIAIQLYLVLNKTAYLLKVAYREEYSSYAPGQLLLFKFIENCHSKSHIKEINLLAVRNWHKPWKPQESKLYDIMFMPKKYLYSSVIKLIYQAKHLLY